MSFTKKVNGVKETRVLWYENILSFKLRYNTIKKEGLRGFSAWALGQEDDRIWTVLPIRK
jgi:spore germination protein YaaH